MVGPDHIQVAVAIHRNRHRREAVLAIAVRRQTLTSSWTSGGNRTERFRGHEAADADRSAPMSGVVARVGRRALHHHDLVDPRTRRVAVAEGHVDRAVRTDGGMRALILIAGRRAAR